MKDGVLAAIIAIALIASISYTFYHTIILQDFQAENSEGDSSATESEE